MKQIILLFATGIFVLSTSSMFASDDLEKVFEEKYVVSLITDEFELEETDLSHLAVGDAETILTESGKTVDLLRTEDGIEIYIDGELLDIGMGDVELHGSHKIIHTDVEIICDEDEECEENIWISEDGDIDLEALHASGDHKVIKIKHGEPGDDMGELHEAHGEKIIIIKKTTEDEI